MSATACLHIVVQRHIASASGIDVLDIVEKVTTAFLESRWSWPRKFGAVTQTSYILTDPSAATIDPAEIQKLSNKLQIRLFGVGEGGKVAIAAFEGSPEDVVRFSKLNTDELAMLLNGGSLDKLGLSGRLTKLTPSEASVLHEAERAPASAAASDVAETKLLYRGVYLAPKQEFVGSQVSRWRADDLHQQSVLNGLENYPIDDPESFDRETIAAVARAFETSPPNGLIFIPLSYTALARPRMRERYQKHLTPLARMPKALLVARIYDVPRTPQFIVLEQMKTLLQDYVALVDLAVADAGTDVGAVGTGIVRGIALVLPTADEIVRTAAINRFMTNHERFRSQKLWPGIGNVKTLKEAQLAASLKVAFLGGPGICGILEKPVGVLPFLMDGLPLTAEPR